ncbi:MAG: ribosome maturation factor RimM [Fusobacteriaceae bacterium]|jgi:16S rRNA processing protein RimM|nr:ribosome maturation factor RimM [Fusobacteriaceae bacterium]
MTELIEIGKIWASHNLRGTVKVISALEDISFLVGEKVVVKKYKSEEVVLTVKFLKQTAPDKWILDFENINTRDGADSLRNGIIKIHKELLPASEEKKSDSYLHMKAVNHETLEDLGIVTDFFAAPTYTILVVENETHEILIPCIDRFLKKVDMENNTLYVEILEGMIEEKDKKRKRKKDEI